MRLYALLGQLVGGASRTACADTEDKHLDRVRVRPRRMLRDTQGIVIPADGPPRNNPRGTRLHALGVVRRYRALARHGSAAALLGEPGSAVDSREHEHGRWPTGTLSRASSSHRRPCFTEPWREATFAPARPSPVVWRLAAGPRLHASCSRSARGSAVRREPENSLLIRKSSKIQLIRLTGLSSVLL